MNLILVDTKEDKSELKSVFTKTKKRGNVCLSFVLQGKKKDWEEKMV